MSATLDIVIVNWNAGRRLWNCLESIAACHKAGFALTRVVVVDNASSDGSVAELKDYGLPLVIIKNLENFGFAVACNQGAFESRADLLLFLNPDTRLFEDTLSNPVEFMLRPENATIGICGVRLIDDSGGTTVSCARFPTVRVLFGKATGLTAILPRLFPSHLMKHDECSFDREVDQVIGAFFLVRRSLFDKLGGFDERFFVYFEEVDFAYRARQLGYISYLLAGTLLCHKGCVSSDQIKARRLFYFLRSRIQYGFKHFSALQKVALLLITFGVEFPGRLLGGFFSFSAARLLETWGGYSRLMTYYLKRAIQQ